MPLMSLVTDSLSDEGRRVMVSGFQQSMAAEKIAQAIKDATGEVVAVRTVARRAAEWRSELARREQARERMEDLVRAVREGGPEGSEMIQALAMERLIENPDALFEADPVKVQKLHLQAEELRLKKRALEVKERAIAAVERRLELLEAREKRALEALQGDKGETMTDAERVRRVREIYGLS